MTTYQPRYRLLLSCGHQLATDYPPSTPTRTPCHLCPPTDLTTDYADRAIVACTDLTTTGTRGYDWSDGAKELD